MEITILEKLQNADSGPLIVAELSGNHGGDLDKALKLVESAVDAGADAIKLQTYKPETITVNSKDDRFLIKKGLWTGKYLHDLYSMAMTPWEWHRPLAEKAKELGSVLFSSPFDETAVDFLEKTIEPILYKVASFELNHFPLLEEIGKTGRPVLASVGVSSLVEIERAVDVLLNSGSPLVCLLHCVSEYPAEPDSFNLSSIKILKTKFGMPVGLSDHSRGCTVAVAATSMGARVIEKHFTLDRNEDSIDGEFSMLPHEFAQMVEQVKIAHAAIGSVGYYQNEKSAPGAFFKRSILVSRPVQKDEVFTEENLRIARPGDGLCPSLWTEVLGSRASANFEVGHPLTVQDFKKV